jgi:hypothetical protein
MRFLIAIIGVEELYTGRAEVFHIAQQVGEQHPTPRRLVEHRRLDDMNLGTMGLWKL